MGYNQAFPFILFIFIVVIIILCSNCVFLHYTVFTYSLYCGATALADYATMMMMMMMMMMYDGSRFVNLVNKVSFDSS